MVDGVVVSERRQADDYNGKTITPLLMTSESGEQGQSANGSCFCFWHAEEEPVWGDGSVMTPPVSQCLHCSTEKGATARWSHFDTHKVAVGWFLLTGNRRSHAPPSHIKYLTSELSVNRFGYRIWA